MNMDYIIEEALRRELALVPVDRHHDIKEFRYVPGDSAVKHSFQPFEQGQGPRALQVSEHAFGQLGKRIGYPAPYIRGLPPRLRDELVNYHVHIANKYNRPLMLRTLEGGAGSPDLPWIRAIVTEAYRTFDDTDLLDAAAEAFNEAGVYAELEVVHYDQADVSHFRFIWGQEIELEPGKVMRRGLSLRNSEIGESAISIRGMNWVVACMNGALSLKDTLAIIHQGRKAGLSQKVRDAVRLAMQDVDHITEAYRQAINDRIGQPNRAFENWNNRTGLLTQEQFTRSLDAWVNDGAEPTRYGLVNSITQAAHDEPILEGRYQMELAAARMLEARLAA